jgi:hypothetical protein
MVRQTPSIVKDGATLKASFDAAAGARPIIVILVAVGIGAALLAIFARDESGMPSWVSVVVPAVFFLLAGLVKAAGTLRYEAAFDLSSRRWRAGWHVLGLGHARRGTFDNLRAVEIQRRETLNDGFTGIGYLLLVHLKEGRPFYPIVTEFSDVNEARVAAGILTKDLGIDLEDHSVA